MNRSEISNEVQKSYFKCVKMRLSKIIDKHADISKMTIVIPNNFAVKKEQSK